MTSGDPSGGGRPGQAGLNSNTSDYNAQYFLVRQLLGRTRTTILVQVKAVTNEGAVSAVGFVDAQPLVNLMDGVGKTSPHGIILNLPYFRMQGGKNAIILDPQVDDIGLAVICDRDISTVKETKKRANPGSYRRFDLADGVYIGGILNGVPEQYVRFFADGIDIVDKNENFIKMKSEGIDINGALIDRNGEVTAKHGTGDSVTLTGHTHHQPVDSHGDTEAPTNPPTAGT